MLHLEDFKKDIKRRSTTSYQFATAGNCVLLWLLDPYKGTLEIIRANAGRNNRVFTCISFCMLPDTSGSSGLVERILTGTTSGDLIDFIVSPRIGENPTVRMVGSTALCAGGIKVWFFLKRRDSQRWDAVMAPSYVFRMIHTRSRGRMK